MRHGLARPGVYIALRAQRPGARWDLSRAENGPGTCAHNRVPTPHSPFPVLVDYSLADLDSEGRIASATRFNYERDINRLVLPAFKGFSLREIGVTRCDARLKQLGNSSYSSAKRARTVLRQSFALAVRHEVLVQSDRPRVPAAQAEADPDRADRDWGQCDPGSDQGLGVFCGDAGPNPDGQLGHIVEVMLGTSARIGEVLAIRRRDLDLTTTPATLRICGTVISERGLGTYRQEHPKTDCSNRVIAVPSFTAEALRRRLAIMADHSLEALVFRSREETPLTTANVRRQLRKVLGDAGIEGVSPHMFRRAVATVINERAA